MAQVGAKYPMMLYGSGQEVIVYDDEDYDAAKKNGFSEHPAMAAAEKSEGAGTKEETATQAAPAPAPAQTTVSVTATKTTQPAKK